MDYDLEIDKLITFLFPEGIQEEYEENSDFIAYLNKLGGFKVEQFYKESKTLAEKKFSVDNETKNLALTNYKTFIQTAECSHNIFKEVCSIEDDLNAFLEATPKLLSACEKFIENSSTIKERRRRNNLILSHSSKILQILEIPEFMNSCIQNEMYEEALLLPSFVKRLASKHGNISLINNIVKDIEKSWWELMRHLLRHLTADISLPKCLHIIGYLRRMNIFSEAELRLKFLQARGFWLDSLLATILTEDKNQHLSAVIDITRVNVFNISTQYKAVFTDDEIVTRPNDLKNCIFYCWLNKKINDFLAIVETDLSFCSPGSLDSLLEQCMYFGQSFGRIGADFRGLAVKLFIKTVEDNFESSVRKANEQFQFSMKKFALPRSVSASNVNFLKNSSGLNVETLSPPICLLEFQPLAEYCNSILNAFNDLRYCNPASTIFIITSVLQTSLVQVSSELFSYYEKHNVAWLEKEKEIFLILCSYYSENLITFIQRCLVVLYEPTNIAKYFSISLLELENEGLLCLNLLEIRKPLANIL